MKKYFEVGLYVVGGAVAGSLTTFFALKNHIRRKEEEKARLEISNFVDGFRKSKYTVHTVELSSTEEDTKDIPAEEPKPDYIDYSAAFPTSTPSPAASTSLSDEPKRVTRLEYQDIVGIPDLDIHTFEAYENNVLTDFLTGEKLSDDEIERTISLEEFEDLYTHGTDILYFWNDELGTYYRVDLMFVDYPEDSD